MKSPAERLLGGQAFGTLTDEERRELYAAALEDQEIFDALAEQEPLRELLADRAVRNELLDTLDRPSLVERVRAALRRPATWGDLATAAATLVVAVVATQLLMPRSVEAPHAASARAPLLRALFDLPLRQVVGDELRIEGKRITFRVQREAQVIVATQAPNGAVVQLFPEPGGTTRVAAGVAVSMARPRGVGEHRVRLVAFPPTVNPFALDVRGLRALAPHVTVIERIDRFEGGNAS